MIGKAIATLLSFTAIASSAIYYVDAANGQDDSDGLRPDGAWKTLAQVNTASFDPGDYVLLHRDQVWQERLFIGSSGAPDKPIVFGAYGDGRPPVIDGSGMAVPDHSGLVVLTRKSFIVFDGLEVRNSARNGIVPYLCQSIVIRNSLVHDNRQNGLLAFDTQGLTVTLSEFYNNSLDPQASYSGISIDGSGVALSGFLVNNCRIHDNTGGMDWNSGNGILLGHTGDNIPVLKSLTISGNEIYRNGNPNQNQAGRGISGSFQGDATISGNYIHHNASAGMYLGDEGLQIQMSICYNTFKSNALRQFGGFTDGIAGVCHNTLIVDDPAITGMGAEVGGHGSWSFTGNVFYFYGATKDAWRSFIRINDAAQDTALQSDYNIFYSGGPNRWKKSDGVPLSFREWQAAGYDKHSVNPQ